MNRISMLAAASAVALSIAAGARPAAAQDQHIPISKDDRGTVSSTSYGDVDLGIDWRGPLGYTLRPGAAAFYCDAADADEVAKVAIKSDLYRQGMITPDQAKALALCAVPGQIGSGEMETADGRTIYDISLIPNDKKTYTKIQIDAYTGEVVNAKQFGGLRGLAGFLRESAERKENKAKATP